MILNGLPRPEGLHEVFSLVTDDILDILNGVVDSSNSGTLPEDWTRSGASMITPTVGLTSCSFSRNWSNGSI